ncbi:MAG: glycosyltransferase family 2 protein [Acidimicrobiia bacterium]|nr:glycosyltransferase family 2 protein [Acidimicrobiia bacterium]NNJ46228.1 glycosyltransferase family 2 protein [Acidimicrobiia bacterium]
MIDRVHEGDPRVDVTVVLPVFNEAGHLEKEIHRVRESMEASSYSYEILVVDDGSTDGSGEILRGLDGIRLLQFATNRGSGSARKYGTLAARGGIVVWTDVDMTYPNDRIPELVDELEHHDQVVGARRSEEGTLKLLRRPAKWFIRKLASYLTGARIPDLNSGFRAFRRDVALQFLYLLPRGFSCVTTITMTFLSNGYTVKYTPIDYFPRAGESKFHWWKDTRRYLLQVVRMVLSYSPLKVLMPPAILLGLIGAGKLVFDLFDKNFRIGTNTLVILGLSVSLAILAMLADLLVQLNKKRHDVIPAIRTH